MSTFILCSIVCGVCDIFFVSDILVNLIAFLYGFIVYRFIRQCLTLME